MSESKADILKTIDDLPDTMDRSFVKDLVTPAANSILELSMEAGVDIEETPALWDLVLLAYPHYTPGANMALCGIDVYILKLTTRDGQAKTLYKVGEETAMRMLKSELAEDYIADISIRRLGEDD